MYKRVVVTDKVFLSLPDRLVLYGENPKAKYMRANQEEIDILVVTGAVDPATLLDFGYFEIVREHDEKDNS